MKKILFITFCLIGFNSLSQDTLTDFTINASWVNPEDTIVENIDSSRVKVAESFKLENIVEKIIPSWIAPESFFEKPTEELTEEDVKELEKDVEFLTELPQSYEV